MIRNKSELRYNLLSLMTLTDKVKIQTKIGKAVFVDAIVLAFVYYIPTLSHFFSVPLYYFEPMRISLFVSILFLCNRRNAFFLAISLPLFSFWVSGHPIIVKNVIMSIELFLNVLILYKLIDRGVDVLLSCFVSIIASKMVYYCLKFVVINEGLIQAGVIETPIFIQLIIAILLSLLFGLIIKRQRV